METEIIEMLKNIQDVQIFHTIISGITCTFVIVLFIIECIKK